MGASMGKHEKNAGKEPSKGLPSSTRKSRGDSGPGIRQNHGGVQARVPGPSDGKDQKKETPMTVQAGSWFICTCHCAEAVNVTSRRAAGGGGGKWQEFTAPP